MMVRAQPLCFHLSLPLPGDLVHPGQLFAGERQLLFEASVRAGLALWVLDQPTGIAVEPFVAERELEERSATATAWLSPAPARPTARLSRSGPATAAATSSGRR